MIGGYDQGGCDAHQISAKTRLSALVFVAGLFAFSTHVQAASVYFGADQHDSTASTNAAYSAWQAAVGSFTQESFDGLVVSSDRASAVTSLGSSFAAIDSDLFWRDTTTQSDEGGILSGTHMRAERSGTTESYGFTWILPSPADAVGIFGVDNDGGQLTVSLTNGGTQTFAFDAAPGGSDRLFWGISGLSSAIDSISVLTTDPGGSTRWDNLVYGTNSVLPIPAAALLFASALGLFGWIASHKNARTKRAELA